MDFYTILDQVIALLRQRQRVTYQALQRQFHLDEAALNDLKTELLYVYPQVREDPGRGLIWAGDTDTASPVDASPASPCVSSVRICTGSMRRPRPSSTVWLQASRQPASSSSSTTAPSTSTAGRT